MSTPQTEPTHESHYLAHRGAMLAAAYRIAGSRIDAEDVVQDVWTRWAEVDLDSVHTPQAYLVTMTTRQALNRARAEQRRREDYVGPWLPEPWRVRSLDPTTPRAPDPVTEVEQAESISMAMLVVLASLTPLERAVFVLHEVFALSYAEIAASLDRSPDAVRQLAHRARSHVHSRRPHTEVSATDHAEATTLFAQAVQGGSIEALMNVLSPDVVLTSDGGGKVSAATRPIVGHERVARFLLGLVSKYEPDSVSTMPVEINGQLSFAIEIDGHLNALLMIEAAQGVISNVFILRNPDKLHRLAH
ncbi:MAG: RNA polymerase sigma factor SigJ [Ornithinimicrobium sp.]